MFGFLRFRRAEAAEALVRALPIAFPLRRVRALPLRAAVCTSHIPHKCQLGVETETSIHGGSPPLPCRCAREETRRVRFRFLLGGPLLGAGGVTGGVTCGRSACVPLPGSLPRLALPNAVAFRAVNEELHRPLGCHQPLQPLSGLGRCVVPPCRGDSGDDARRPVVRPALLPASISLMHPRTRAPSLPSPDAKVTKQRYQSRGSWNACDADRTQHPPLWACVVAQEKTGGHRGGTAKKGPFWKRIGGLLDGAQDGRGLLSS
jgi:hypothetical protein